MSLWPGTCNVVLFCSPWAFTSLQETLRKASRLPDIADLLRLCLLCHFSLSFVLLSWVSRLQSRFDAQCERQTFLNLLSYLLYVSWAASGWIFFFHRVIMLFVCCIVSTEKIASCVSGSERFLACDLFKWINTYLWSLFKEYCDSSLNTRDKMIIVIWLVHLGVNSSGTLLCCTPKGITLNNFPFLPGTNSLPHQGKFICIVQFRHEETQSALQGRLKNIKRH